jgi:hypothetical protein
VSERVVPRSFEIVGKLVIVVLLAGLSLVAMLVVCLHVVSTWRSSYVLHSTGERIDAAAERAALQRYNSALPCEWLGKDASVEGRPALRYRISAEHAPDEIACLQARAPAGFKIVKEGFF